MTKIPNTEIAVRERKLIQLQRDLMNSQQRNKLAQLIEAIRTFDTSLGNPHRLRGLQDGFYKGYRARDFTLDDKRGSFRLIYKFSGEDMRSRHVEICGITDYHDGEWITWTPEREHKQPEEYHKQQANSLIIVSAAGGRKQTDVPTLRVPKSSEVVFFGEDNSSLSGGDAYFVMNSLFEHRKVQKTLAEIVRQ